MYPSIYLCLRNFRNYTHIRFTVVTPEDKTLVEFMLSPLCAVPYWMAFTWHFKSPYHGTWSPFKHMGSGSVNCELRSGNLMKDHDLHGELSKVHLPTLDFFLMLCK